MGRFVGYARVSTVGQTLDCQILTLKEHGCKQIFKEKMSGANTNRPQLNNLLKYTTEGDTIIVTRIDRLARSTFDLFTIISKLKEKKVHFYSLAEPWVDTTTSTGRLMLAVLGGLADVERDLIRIRTAEGRARAIRQGIKMGRPSRISKMERAQILQRRESGQTFSKIAAHYKIAPSTVMRIVRNAKEEC